MAVSIKILIVDDDRDLADEWMKAKLERHPDISVVATCSVERDMLSLVELHNPDVVLIDMMWHGNESVGKRLAAQLRTHSPLLPLIVYSTAPGALTGVDADYRLVKPISADQFAETIRNALHLRKTGDQKPTFTLTKQELATLAGIVKGKTDREIAAAINVAPTTVKDYVGSILSKMHAPNRAAAAAIAIKHKLIDDTDI